MLSNDNILLMVHNINFLQLVIILQVLILQYTKTTTIKENFILFKNV